MIVTAHELQADIYKYLALVDQEDIIITHQGRPLAHMSKPVASAVDSLRGLLKHAPQDSTIRSIRAERLTSHEDHV